MEENSELKRQFEVEIYQYLQRSRGLYPRYLVISSIDFCQITNQRYSSEGGIRFMGVQILESPNLKKNEFILSEEKMKL